MRTQQISSPPLGLSGRRPRFESWVKNWFILFCSVFATQNLRQKLKTKQHSKNLVKSSCAKKIVDLTIYRLTRKFNESWKLVRIRKVLWATRRFFKTWTHFNPCFLNLDYISRIIIYQVTLYSKKGETICCLSNPRNGHPFFSMYVYEVHIINSKIKMIYDIVL